MIEELKPCYGVGCGHRPTRLDGLVQETYNGQTWYSIRCSRCGAQSSRRLTPKDAIWDWEQIYRVKPPELSQQKITDWWYVLEFDDFGPFWHGSFPDRQKAMSKAIAAGNDLEPLQIIHVRIIPRSGKHAKVKIIKDKK